MDTGAPHDPFSTAAGSAPMSRGASQEDRFRALADAAPVLIWTAAPDKGCDWCNLSWLRFTGRSLEEERGFGWAQGIHPDDYERCVKVYSDAFDAREPFEMEYRLRRHDGQFRWLLDRGVPWFDQRGVFVGYVGSCVDIQDIKEAEAERAGLLEAERAARASTEQVADRLRRLQTVTAALARALTPEEVYTVVVEQAVSAAGAQAGVVCRLDDDGATIELRRAVGYPPEHLEGFHRFPVDADVPMAEAIRTGSPVFIGSIPELDSGYHDFKERAQASRRESAASLPLNADGRCMGGLGLSFNRPQSFDASQQAFLEAVAAQAAAALLRTRLWRAEARAREELQRAHERLAFLAEVTEVTSATLDRLEVLRLACDLAVPRMADFASAFVQEGGELQRVAVAHSDPACLRALGKLVNRLPYPINADVSVAECFRTRRPQLHVEGGGGRFSGVGAHPEVIRTLRDLRLGPSLFVPIIARERAIGVLALAFSGNRAPHTPEDVTVAMEFASRIGSAMDNAVLFERQHAVAEQLQRAVLPQRLPEAPELDIAARYLPASHGFLVGGDWYDAFRLRDGRFGLAVGDVAGHGVLAAAKMGQLRNALRAYASEGDSPGTVLGRLSHLLADDGDGVYATASYALYDPKSQRLRWATAGHPPPLLCSKSGSRFLEEPADLMLGVDPQETYRARDILLEPGDLVLWYTDGLVERRGEDLDVGMQRLATAISHLHSDDVDALCDGVLARLLGDEPHGDDVCLLAVRPH